MVRPCYTKNELIPPMDPNSFIAHLLCDPWAVQHIMGPMFLYILTQNWPIVWLIVLINEVFEEILVQISDSSLLFPGVDSVNDIESTVQRLIDDGLIQVSIGLILGGLFVYALKSPVLWKGWRTNRRQWWFYFIVTLFYLLGTVLTSMTIEKPTGLEGVSSSNANKTDLWIGPQLTTIAIGGVTLLAQYGEPFYSTAWLKEPSWKRRWFWGSFWSIYACFNIQSTWDWFYSGHAQTWLLSGILAVILMTIIVIDGDWIYTIRRFGSWADRWKPQPEMPKPELDFSDDE